MANRNTSESSLWTHQGRVHTQPPHREQGRRYTQLLQSTGSQYIHRDPLDKTLQYKLNKNSDQVLHFITCTVTGVEVGRLCLHNFEHNRYIFWGELYWHNRNNYNNYEAGFTEIQVSTSHSINIWKYWWWIISLQFYKSYLAIIYSLNHVTCVATCMRPMLCFGGIMWE